MSTFVKLSFLMSTTFSYAVCSDIVSEEAFFIAMQGGHDLVIDNEHKVISAFPSTNRHFECNADYTKYVVTCTNCEMCSNCYDCENVRFSENCRNCKVCRYCNFCDNCENCYGLTNCKKCTKSNYMSSCTNTHGSKFNFKVNDSTKCSFSNECYTNEACSFLDNSKNMKLSRFMKDSDTCEHCSYCESCYNSKIVNFSTFVDMCSKCIFTRYMHCCFKCESSNSCNYCVDCKHVYRGNVSTKCRFSEFLFACTDNRHVVAALTSNSCSFDRYLNIRVSKNPENDYRTLPMFMQWISPIPTPNLEPGKSVVIHDQWFNDIIINDSNEGIVKEMIKYIQCRGDITPVKDAVKDITFVDKFIKNKDGYNVCNCVNYSFNIFNSCACDHCNSKYNQIDLKYGHNK